MMESKMGNAAYRFISNLCRPYFNAIQEHHPLGEEMRQGDISYQGPVIHPFRRGVSVVAEQKADIGRGHTRLLP
jgi:hypothetical protein